MDNGKHCASGSGTDPAFLYTGRSWNGAVYFFIVYSFLNAVFYTANGVAYNSLPVMITNNPVERVIIGVILSIAVLFGSILVSSATLGLVQSFWGGLTGWKALPFIASLHGF